MSSAMLAAIKAGEMRPAIFVQAQFKTGTVYIWTGYGTITWGGHDWVGVGTLASISAIEEGATVEARGISIGLSGIDNGLLADVLQEFQVGAPVVIYLGLFNSASPPALLADPLCAFAGQADQPTIDVGADLASISIATESRLLLNNVSCEERYDQDTQAHFFPGDLGMSFILGLQNQVLSWGRVPSASTQA
jgi:hypothetical protein